MRNVFIKILIGCLSSLVATTTLFILLPCAFLFLLSFDLTYVSHYMTYNYDLLFHRYIFNILAITYFILPIENNIVVLAYNKIVNEKISINTKST